jgi:hypothetical protein
MKDENQPQKKLTSSSLAKVWPANMMEPSSLVMGAASGAFSASARTTRTLRRALVMTKEGLAIEGLMRDIGLAAAIIVDECVGI